MSKRRNKKGFSLIEVIIAITILGVIGVITSSLFSRVFQGSNKSELIGRVKQSGQVTLNVIDEAIRTADVVICYRSDDTNNPTRKTGILLRTQAGKLVVYRFVEPTSSANGYVAKQDTNLAPNGGMSICTSPPDTANEIPITDKNVTTGVSVSSGQFILPITSASFNTKDTITIKFDVGPGITAPPGIDNNLGTPNYVTFQTTVQIR